MVCGTLQGDAVQPGTCQLYGPPQAAAALHTGGARKSCAMGLPRLLQLYSGASSVGKGLKRRAGQRPAFQPTICAPQ
eukprot:9601681-Karenia_brevis.AAC.1